MTRAALIALCCATPATAQTVAEAAAANLALGIETCVRNMPQVEAARNALAAAGFVYTAEPLGGGDTIHWYAAPADTAAVGIYEGQMAPDCRVTTRHMGVGQSVAFAGAVLEQRFPGLFQYGNLENTPAVTPQNMGGRWEFCTGYVGWNGQRPITVAIANDGNDPACVEDGTTQIVIAF